ncbi:MAG: lactate utilization protein [Bacteroidetes bacterium]|nr:lactate utilization protein [Bacteroidota bacterium]
MGHPEEASRFLANADRAKWHDQTLWMVRQKRDVATGFVSEWEELRSVASAIKEHTLSRLDDYLTEFESNALLNGIKVHWAENADEHNRIVLGILSRRKIDTLVKSKSILTEECHLNDFLQENGIEVIDTDLGERIVQFAKQPPSHIVMPAIHMKRGEISELFHEKLGTEKGNEDATYLTRAARKHLRDKFLKAKAALTGVNFAIAETGGFVVCTNEGNADMGVHLADVHIASMGIEKLIPRWEDLGVFTRILARSGTGQAITNYTSHFHKPRKGQELHLILVDNGRTKQLGREHFRSSLKCIRCGACMNTCPVYRRSGGFSYKSTVPGPIGSILSPGIDLKKYSSLPFASSLCGSCSDVCPVKINIHDQLYRWRQEIMQHNNGQVQGKIFSRMAGFLLASPFWYRVLSSMVTGISKVFPGALKNSFLVWGNQREFPPVPRQTFRDWFDQNAGKG